MKEYINKKMIEDGLISGVIIPCMYHGELACEIGDSWFWFGGTEFEYTNPDDMSFSLKVQEIKTVLDAFYEDARNGDEYIMDEYLYYYYYLCEHI